MNMKIQAIGAAFVVMIAGATFPSTAGAQCGAYLMPKASLAIKASLKPAAYLLSSVRVSDDWNFNRNDSVPAAEPIVGMWKVKFVAENSPGIPNNVEVDHGYTIWHSDNTEFLNSARTPLMGNFCLGVWKKVGTSRYTLNHYAMAFDATGLHSVGTVNIREEVTVDPSGNSYTGSFSIDAYDTNGVHYPANTPGNHANGVITGIRITVDTPSNDH